MGLDTGKLYQSYIDAPLTFPGAQWKAAVVAATSASDGNIALSTAISFNADGHSVQIGDRVFLGFQTDDSENGLYTLTISGLIRTTDADAWAELVGGIFQVLNGDTYEKHYLKLTVSSGGTLETTPITWSDLGIGYGLGTIQLYGDVEVNTPEVYTFNQYQTFCFNLKLTADATVQGTLGIYLTNVSEDTPNTYSQTPFKKLTILNGKFHDGVNPDTVIDVLDGARTVSALYMILYWQAGDGSYGDARVNIFGSITY